MKLHTFLMIAMALTTSSSLSANDDWQSMYQSGKLVNDQGHELPYRWLTPNEYKDSGNEKYPLLIFLHGAGERGDDNQAQLVHCAVEFTKEQNRQSHPAVVVFPQCPREEKWADVDWSLRKIDFNEQPSASMQQVFDLIEKMSKDYRIDPSRIYIAGLSMGGYGTWNAVGHRPELFAAAIPVCGGADLDWAEKVSKTPIWAFHGDADTAVPVENSRTMVAKLKEINAPIKYTEYPGVGHNSWTQTFANQEVIDWLFEQHR